MAAIKFTTKGIADIPAKQQINDADKLLVYEDGKAKSMTYKDVVEPIKNDVKDTFTGVTNALSIKETVTGEFIRVEDSASMPLVELKIFGKTTQEAGASPTTPKEMTSIEDVEVTSCGKNLVNAPDNSINGNGYLFNVECYLEPGIYTMSGEIGTSASSVTSWRISGKGDKILFNGSDYAVRTFELTEPATNFRFYSGKSDGNYCKNIMIEKGSEATAYEPYRETKGSFDGVLRGIPMPATATDYTYIDENNQKWLSDYVVKRADGTGKYIQRVCSIKGNDFHSIPIIKNNSVADNYLYYFSIPSSHAVLKPVVSDRRALMSNVLVVKDVHPGVLNKSGNTNDTEGITVDPDSNNGRGVIYFNVGTWITANSIENNVGAVHAFIESSDLEIQFGIQPVETELTSEELACVFNGYLPVTNVYTNKDAGLEVTYIADPKTYIDNAIVKAITAHESETA